MKNHLEIARLAWLKALVDLSKYPSIGNVKAEADAFSAFRALEDEQRAFIAEAKAVLAAWHDEDRSERLGTRGGFKKNRLFAGQVGRVR